jgi:hypothetical protein
VIWIYGLKVLIPVCEECFYKTGISVTGRYKVFALARCVDCGHDFLVAFSYKGRGVCPLSTTRRMAETAAHLTDHVFPRLSVRQWLLSVPKRLRYFLLSAPKALNTPLRIFLRVRLHPSFWFQLNYKQKDNIL